MRFFIEGYDSRNWGDVLMATSSAQLMQELDPEGEILFARELPYSDPARHEIFDSRRVNSKYGQKPAWNVFFKAKGPFDISYRARQAKMGDVLVFCNGYIFGDPWPTKWLKRIAGVFETLRKRGVKIILMPQSFGPFDRSERTEIFERIIRSASLILTRDGQSMDYLHHSGLSDLNVVQSIDYTGMLNGSPAFTPSAPRASRLCVIPNVKIREKYGDDAAEEYVELLASIARRAIWTHGLDVSLVHHTAGKDESLIHNIRSRVDADINVLKDDPLETRRFIGGSGLVVSSRFHGVMNGLTQNVPVLSLGWSHKYSEIMKRYGVQDFSVVGKQFGDVPHIFDRMITERSQLVQTLQGFNDTSAPKLFGQLRGHVVKTIRAA